jgi:hypothetical protein
VSNDDFEGDRLESLVVDEVATCVFVSLKRWAILL